MRKPLSQGGACFYPQHKILFEQKLEKRIDNIVFYANNAAK
jgi:hypothetical protein